MSTTVYDTKTGLVHTVHHGANVMEMLKTGRYSLTKPGAEKKVEAKPTVAPPAPEPEAPKATETEKEDKPAGKPEKK